MLSARQVGRKLSNKLKMTTSEIYSGRNTLSEYNYNKVEQSLQSLKDYPVYYVDTPGTVDQIKNTVIQFMQTVAKDKWLIITLDHTLLTKKRSGESERQTLQELQNIFIELKKYGKNTIIQLSQLNRNIEEIGRIQNITMHYPMRTDIFGGDSVFQASDVVIVIHRPEILLGNQSYGPGNFPTEGLVYLHFLKVREGDPGIILFKNDLKYNNLIETTFEEYKTEKALDK